MLFTILLGTMMIPATAGMIPWFIMMSRLGWVNDFKALIIPGCANAFGIFWMRQYCQNNIPKALMEAAGLTAAVVDNSSVSSPINRPSLAMQLNEMLASTCAVLPLLVCFLCASKFFMDGLTAGAVKE
ncbi:MAG: hypothetical protein V8S54_12160 [Lachnospiraceae bacterium]